LHSISTSFWLACRYEPGDTPRVLTSELLTNEIVYDADSELMEQALSLFFEDPYLERTQFESQAAGEGRKTVTLFRDPNEIAQITVSQVACLSPHSTSNF
jgi:hypothetical protein